jgi:hypothetical protein
MIKMFFCIAFSYPLRIFHTHTHTECSWYLWKHGHRNGKKSVKMHMPSGHGSLRPAHTTPYDFKYAPMLLS